MLVTFKKSGQQAVLLGWTYSMQSAPSPIRVDRRWLLHISLMCLCELLSSPKGTDVLKKLLNYAFLQMRSLLLSHFVPMCDGWGQLSFSLCSTLAHREAVLLATSVEWTKCSKVRLHFAKADVQEVLYTYGKSHMCTMDLSITAVVGASEWSAEEH